MDFVQFMIAIVCIHEKRWKIVFLLISTQEKIFSYTSTLLQFADFNKKEFIRGWCYYNQCCVEL